MGAGAVIVASDGLLAPVAGVGAVPGCIGGAAIVGVVSLPLTYVGEWHGFRLGSFLGNSRHQ